MHSHVYDNRSYCIIMNPIKRKIKFEYIQLHQSYVKEILNKRGGFMERLRKLSLL